MSLHLLKVRDDITASFISPPVSSMGSAAYCIQFDYNAPYLAGNAEVQLRLLQWNGHVETTPLWRHNTTTEGWITVTLEVTRSEPFQVKHAESKEKERMQSKQTNKTSLQQVQGGGA